MINRLTTETIVFQIEILIESLLLFIYLILIINKFGSGEGRSCANTLNLFASKLLFKICHKRMAIFIFILKFTFNVNIFVFTQKLLYTFIFL